jgi:hypothetical protein
VCCLASIALGLGMKSGDAVLWRALGAHRPCQKEAGSPGNPRFVERRRVRRCCPPRLAERHLPFNASLKRRSAKIDGSLPLLHLLDRIRLLSG